MKDRIFKLMTEQKMTQQEFAQKLGISAASLSSIFNGRTNPTQNHTTAIHKAFPQISLEWLIFGEGDMYIKGGDMAKEKATMDGEVNEANLFPPDVTSEASNATFDFDMDGGMLSQEAELTSLQRPEYSPKPKVSQMVQNRGQNMVSKNTNIVDKPMRKVNEIRVFYDDGTYESFSPSK